MLSLVPVEVVTEAEESGQYFDWIDYRQQFAAVGVDDPYGESVPIASYVTPLASGDPLFMHAMNPEVEELLGFRLFDVHQVLSAGTPPEMYTAYRGGVEFDAITDLWESSGFSLVTGDHGEYWSRAEDASVDLNDPLSRIVMARWNNLAIVDGTTLVTASTAPMLERVLELVAEGGESAAQGEMIIPLIDAMPAETVNVMAFPGGLFSRAGVMPPNVTPEVMEMLEQRFAESDDAVGSMPPVLSAFGGVTAGVIAATPAEEGAPDMGDVTAFLSFLTSSEDDAIQAANVAFWRIDNMESLVTRAPYTELLDVTNTVDDATVGPVMTVELGPESAVRGMWHRLFFTRDLVPFAW